MIDTIPGDAARKYFEALSQSDEDFCYGDPDCEASQAQWKADHPGGKISREEWDSMMRYGDER